MTSVPPSLRNTYTVDNEPIRGSDLIIEAVVENLGIKHEVNRELEPLLAPGAIWASNTSAIPIGLLSESSQQKDRFIGLHFFSPVEKMPLLEVIQPDACDEETLNRCLAYGKAVGRVLSWVMAMVSSRLDSCIVPPRRHSVGRRRP